MLAAVRVATCRRGRPTHSSSRPSTALPPASTPSSRSCRIERRRSSRRCSRTRTSDALESLDVLDAGCGTGLCGPLVAPYARRLVGVDLSEGMLARARARNVYDELVRRELTAYLHDCTGAFDVIVSADTLVYFGPLEEVLAAAGNALRAGGVLIFTVEELPAAGATRSTPSARAGGTAMRRRTSSACSGMRVCSRRSSRPSCVSRPASRWPGWWCAARKAARRPRPRMPDAAKLEPGTGKPPRGGFRCGPAWIRTRDQRIMSPLL